MRSEKTYSNVREMLIGKILASEPQADRGLKRERLSQRQMNRYRVSSESSDNAKAFCDLQVRDIGV